MLYLASQSPRRRELLQQIGVEFELVDGSVDETPQWSESAAELVCRLAQQKARAGLAQLHKAGRVSAESPGSGPIVLGADTVVVIDTCILGKPEDELDAKSMLQRLAGRCHQVFSAVSICCNEQQHTELSITDVYFRAIDSEELDRYCASGEPLGKAGAYAIQGLASVFVTRIEGSYSGVVGLPLEKLFPLLQAFGVPYWQNGHR